MKNTLLTAVACIFLISCNNDKVEKLEQENEILNAELQNLKFDYECLVHDYSVRQKLPGVYLLAENHRFEPFDKIIFVNDSLCMLRPKHVDSYYEATFNNNGNGIHIITYTDTLYYALIDTGVIINMIVPSVFEQK